MKKKNIETKKTLFKLFHYGLLMWSMNFIIIRTIDGAEIHYAIEMKKLTYIAENAAITGNRKVLPLSEVLTRLR